MTNLDSILKSRDITLPTKVCVVKPVVFPVAMYRCESWTIKKAEHQRIDAFEVWCWRRLLRVPGTARKSNQSILKEISPSNEYSGLISFRIDWFDLAVQGTLKSLVNTTVKKHQFFGAQPSLWSNSHIYTWLLERPQLLLDGHLLAK